MRLSSLAQLKVIANPLRLRLLDAFVSEPRTTMQVARLLDEKPTRLYRHVEALHRAGFLKRRGTRQNRGTTEHYYQAVAGHFEAAPELLAKSGRGASGFARMAGQLLRRTERGLLAAEAAGGVCDDGLMMLGISVEASPAAIARLRKKLEAWIGECTKAPGRGATWQGLIAFYPVTETAAPASDRRTRRPLPAGRGASRTTGR
jgi:hypothetical protein